MTYTNRYIIFKRNTLNQPCSGSVSLQPRRSIAFRCQPGGWGAPSVLPALLVLDFGATESVTLKNVTQTPWEKLLVLKK